MRPLKFDRRTKSVRNTQLSRSRRPRQRFVLGSKPRKAASRSLLRTINSALLRSMSSSTARPVRVARRLPGLQGRQVLNDFCIAFQTSQYSETFGPSETSTHHGPQFARIGFQIVCASDDTQHMGWRPERNGSENRLRRLPRKGRQFSRPGPQHIALLRSTGIQPPKSNDFGKWIGPIRRRPRMQTGKRALCSTIHHDRLEYLALIHSHRKYRRAEVCYYLYPSHQRHARHSEIRRLRSRSRRLAN